MKLFVSSLIAITCMIAAYFILSQDTNSIEARIKALAFEQDNVKRYRMIKQMGKDYPGQPAIDEATLFKFLRQRELHGLPLTDTISYFAYGYHKQRQVWNGMDYKTPEYFFKATTLPHSVPGDTGEPYDFKMLDVRIRDLGFIPKWQRDIENKWYTTKLEGSISAEDQEIAEKIGQEILDFPTDKHNYKKIGDTWWKIENFEHPNYSPDPVQAIAFLNNRFEIEILGWNYLSLDDFRNVVEKIDFDKKLMEKYQ